MSEAQAAVLVNQLLAMRLGVLSKRNHYLVIIQRSRVTYVTKLFDKIT